MVLIQYNHSVLQNKSVPAGRNECVFSALTPGRLYTVTVETWSGDLVSSVSTDGRTCESEIRERACWVGAFPFGDSESVLSLSPRSCGQPVARQRWNRGADRHLEPRPRRRGPL